MQKSLLPFFESRLRFGINCVKSDNFRSKPPENQSGPLFSKTAVPEKRAVGGLTLPRAGYPPVPESGVKFGQALDIMSHQVWQEWPLNVVFTHK